MPRYIVKAVVSRIGSPPTTRFIPLELFELWKSHMKFAYGFDVAEVQGGEWRPAQSATARDSDVDGSYLVVEVIVAGQIRGVPSRVERFFPASELTDILPKFLAHYGIDSGRPEQMSSVQIIQGIFRTPSTPQITADVSTAPKRGH